MLPKAAGGLRAWGKFLKRPGKLIMFLCGGMTEVDAGPAALLCVSVPGTLDPGIEERLEIEFGAEDVATSWRGGCFFGMNRLLSLPAGFVGGRGLWDVGAMTTPFIVD